MSKRIKEENIDKGRKGGKWKMFYKINGYCKFKFGMGFYHRQ